MRTRFKRDVRRLDSSPSTTKSSKSKSKSSSSSLAPLDSNSSSSIVVKEEEDEEDYISPKPAKSKTLAGSSSSDNLNVGAESSSTDHPNATDTSPVWEYMDLKTNQWSALTGGVAKMVEMLSKRSGAFPIQIPGLGAYQITLATMTMKATAPNSDTQIRRTPPLKVVSASPILSKATTPSPVSPSSGSGKLSSKKKKKSSGDDEHEGHMFVVDPDMVAKCKKATNWKEVSSKDSDKLLKDSTCVICCDDFSDGRTVVHLAKCGTHYFHENCIAASFKPGFISCPVCQTIYGIRTGTQPQGTMTHRTSNSERLSGYDKFGTITIHYNFKDGIQGPNHPSPGSPYYGTSRTAYLPDCPEGKKVLQLLKLAFERSLVFTIGTSVTTGQSDCVIWNGIHHKTSTTGGSSNFGYPDATYLERVTDELAAKGVTLD
jgi:deltex-like protein